MLSQEKMKETKIKDVKPEYICKHLELYSIIFRMFKNNFVELLRLSTSFETQLKQNENKSLEKNVS